MEPYPYYGSESSSAWTPSTPECQTHCGGALHPHGFCPLCNPDGTFAHLPSSRSSIAAQANARAYLESHLENHLESTDPFLLPDTAGTHLQLAGSSANPVQFQASAYGTIPDNVLDPRISLGAAGREPFASGLQYFPGLPQEQVVTVSQISETLKPRSAGRGDLLLPLRPANGDGSKPDCVSPDVSDLESRDAPLVYCPHCEKPFKRRSDQIRHVAHTHEHKQRKYKCESAPCGASFHWKKDLKRHMVIHAQLEEVETFRCSILGCTKTFNRKDNYTRHVSRKHSGFQPS